MLVAGTFLDAGPKCWTFHVVNDSAEPIESVIVESVDYEWGDFGNSESVGRRFGPIAPYTSIEILRETDTEVRTSVTLLVRGASGEPRYVAEFGKLYRSPGIPVPIPILDREGKLATLTEIPT